MTTTAAAPTYEALIKEAFIDPIRSVLIVDDQYPTLEDQLRSSIDIPISNDLGETETPIKQPLKKDWKNKAGEINEIVQHFRNNQWLVDIHDGYGVDLDNVGSLTQHLHQSDLLILDYELDAGLGSADKCLKIISHLALNEHFNLVVIHTEADIRVAQREVILSLLDPCPELEKCLLYGSKTKELIEDWELENETILEDLISSISDDLYLEVRKSSVSHICNMLEEEDAQLGKFATLYESKPDGIKLTKKKLLSWVISKKQNKLAAKLSKIKSHGKTEWSTGNSGKNWIRTSKLFITVAAKKNASQEADTEDSITDTRDLPDVLLKALTSWSPLPPRLVLTKLRATIASSGVASEDIFLSNKELQAGWYRELLESGVDQIKSNTESAVDKYWDGLSKPIIGKLSQFTQNVTDCDRIQFEVPENSSAQEIESAKEEHRQTILKSHFCSSASDAENWEKFKKQSKLEQNAYNCSKPPTGWHLTTGHILKIKSDYWVCLTPACDLVPGQKQSNRYKRLKMNMPFKAVKLNIAKDEDAIAGANSNQYIFLRIDNKIRAFSFVHIDKPDANDQPNLATPNPTWDEMFATNQGRITDIDNYTIEIGQISWCKENGLKPIWSKSAKIVAQLRYEYALNLMQRLGTTLTRVGLDFVN